MAPWGRKQQKGGGTSSTPEAAAPDSQAQQAATTTMEAVKSTVESAAGSAKDAFVVAGAQLSQAVSAGADTSKEAAGGAMDKAQQVAAGGKSIVESVKSAVQSAAGSAGTQLSNAVSAGAGASKDAAVAVKDAAGGALNKAQQVTAGSASAAGAAMATLAEAASGSAAKVTGTAAAGFVAAKDKMRAQSSKLGCLYHVSKGDPTNYNMLVFRCLNRDLGLPDANEDTMAALLRDELMPRRMWWYKNWPGAKWQTRNSIENPWWGVPGICSFIDARTKWMDQAVRDAVSRGFTQVVTIAAGFDTRAYRFATPGVTFFEVDLPVASARKQALVEKLKLVPEGAAPPVFVPADLSVEDLGEALANTGAFDQNRKTLFTAEGLLYYLPAQAAEQLIGSVGKLAAPGSLLFFDFMNQDALDGSKKYRAFKNTAKAVANKGEPFLSGLDPSGASLTAVLAPHGFQLATTFGAREMLATMLPAVKWSDKAPPIHSFYSYASAVKT